MFVMKLQLIINVSLIVKVNDINDISRIIVENNERKQIIIFGSKTGLKSPRH